MNLGLAGLVESKKEEVSVVSYEDLLEGIMALTDVEQATIDMDETVNNVRSIIDVLTSTEEQSFDATLEAFCGQELRDAGIDTAADKADLVAQLEGIVKTLETSEESVIVAMAAGAVIGALLSVARLAMVIHANKALVKFLNQAFVVPADIDQEKLMGTKVKVVPADESIKLLKGVLANIKLMIAEDGIKEDQIETMVSNIEGTIGKNGKFVPAKIEKQKGTLESTGWTIDNMKIVHGIFKEIVTIVPDAKRAKDYIKKYKSEVKTSDPESIEEGTKLAESLVTAKGVIKTTNKLSISLLNNYLKALPKNLTKGIAKGVTPVEED